MHRCDSRAAVYCATDRLSALMVSFALNSLECVPGLPDA